MNKSESNGRIRQVAILLSSVDATTARNLLGQLPPSQARLVRQQLATLQNVTPAERESALKMLAQLKHRVGSASNRHPEASPAEALLSQVSPSIDRVDFTSANSTFDHKSSFDSSKVDPMTSYQTGGYDSQFMPIQGRSEYPFQSPAWTPTWQQWSGEELARLLTNERPTLIAAVLLQAPTDLGSAILESLPESIATSVLIALPQLHTTDPSVLQEIYSQLHQRLVDFQRQSNPANAGLAKLQAILLAVSNESRVALQRGLSIAEPLLAHSLGVSAPNAIGKAEFSTAKAANERAIEKNRERIRGNHEIPVVLPFSKLPTGTNVPISEIASFDSFESLHSLSLEDLAIVLRSVDPKTVLLATNNASKAMQTQIERLVDPNEVKRLRERLKGLRSVGIHEKVLAQEKIIQSANSLLQQGRIASLASMSVLVAA